MKNKKDINYNDLSIDDIKKELNKEKYKNSFSKILINTLFVLIIILAIGSIITTLFMPVVEVTNSSMIPLINDGDIVLTYKTNKFKQGDVVAFYHGNKILIKRVIGISGDYVNIDVSGNVYINGSLIQEDYVKELKKGNSNVSFPLQVPANSIFVLSDVVVDVILVLPTLLLSVGATVTPVTYESLLSNVTDTNSLSK